MIKIIANLTANKKLFAPLLLCLIMTSSISVQSQSWTPTTNKHLSFRQNQGNECIKFDNKPTLSGSFTIETWVRLDNNSCPNGGSNSKPVSNDVFVSMGDHQGNPQGSFKGAEVGIQAAERGNGFEPIYGTGPSANVGKFYFIVGDGTGTGSNDRAMVSSTFKPLCNVWYHIAAVYTKTSSSSGNIKMYVNGSQQGSAVTYNGPITFSSQTNSPTNASSNHKPADMTFGKEADHGSSQRGYLDGDLDNVAIWSTAKTYTTSNYDDPIDHSSSNLENFYHFNQNPATSSSTPYDATSQTFSGNNGNQNTNTGTGTGVDYLGNGSGSGPPLPVELLNFELVQDNESVDLFWSTASELNNHFFTLEKSMDGRHWNLLGTVEGNGTTNEISDYTYTDYNPYPIKTFYRLTQTDYDGKFEYLAIKSTNSNDEGIPQMSVRPNPSSDFVNIDYVQFPYSQIRFLNAQGIDVSKEIKVLRNTGNSLMLDISALQNGVYSVVGPTSSAFLLKL